MPNKLIEFTRVEYIEKGKTGDIIVLTPIKKLTKEQNAVLHSIVSHRMKNDKVIKKKEKHMSRFSKLAFIVGGCIFLVGGIVLLIWEFNWQGSLFLFAIAIGLLLFTFSE